MPQHAAIVKKFEDARKDLSNLDSQVKGLDALLVRASEGGDR